MADVFARVRLRPGQLRTVADRRWDDADYLRRSRLNARANGVFYLGGFVLECLLKAKLLEKYTWLQRPPGDLSRRPARERRLHTLCYQRHDLAAILEMLPELTDRLGRFDRRRLQQLKNVCSVWTIFARYSPHTAEMAEASRFLDQIKDLKPWLTN